MPTKTSAPGLSHLRVTFSAEFYLGPGRADLLEGIAETGSIAAAGKRMGMSYKRAWSLVQALNHGWGTPLVGTVRGGAAQGGAALTADGKFALEQYRLMQHQASTVIEPNIVALKKRLDMSRRK